MVDQNRLVPKCYIVMDKLERVQNDIQNILVLKSNTTGCYTNSRCLSITRPNRYIDLLHLPFPKTHLFLVFLHILCFCTFFERERERERERN